MKTGTQKMGNRGRGKAAGSRCEPKTPDILPDSNFPLYALAEEMIDGLTAMRDDFAFGQEAAGALRVLLDAARAAEIELREARKLAASQAASEALSMAVAGAFAQSNAKAAALRARMRELVADLQRSLRSGDPRWTILGIDGSEWTGLVAATASDARRA